MISVFYFFFLQNSSSTLNIQIFYKVRVLLITQLNVDLTFYKFQFRKTATEQIKSSDNCLSVAVYSQM